MGQQNYEELDFIGSGAYGTVFRARDRDNNRTVALKRVKIAKTEEGVPVATIREISMLKLLDQNAHPNVVRFYDVFQTFSTSYGRRECILTLVFEHVDQDLAQFIEKHPPPGLPEHVIKDMMQQLIGAIYFLHTNRMLHRDLKPQNILVTNDGQIKVADFGLARIYSFCMVLTSVVITLWYRSPEVLLQTTYATGVDMWSLGCIFAEMYNRRPLFPGRSDADQLKKIFATIGTPPQSQWPTGVSLPWSTFERYQSVNPNLLSLLVPDMCSEGKSLLKKLLTFNPADRISAQEAVDHPFFSGSDTGSNRRSGAGLCQRDAANGTQQDETVNNPTNPEQLPSASNDVEEVNETRNGVGVSVKRKRSREHDDDDDFEYDDYDDYDDDDEDGDDFDDEDEDDDDLDDYYDDADDCDGDENDASQTVAKNVEKDNDSMKDET